MNPVNRGRRVLRERLAIIANEESRREPDRLREVSEKIERLGRSLPPKIEPELGHFLQRRSYGKSACSCIFLSASVV